jgi:hypothetical protein
MGRKAAIISIDVNAGTAKMLVDLEKGKAGLRSFGSQGASSMHQFGAAGVTEHRAVAAAMKTVEGSFTNNRRAADAFLVMIPGLGKAVQAAFPVVGAIAFAGVIGEVGKKVYDFFKGMEEGPAKIANAFRSLNQAVHLSNDELLVSNDRLANDIAKLEGRRQNTLKLALDEARVAADKLAESLEKDLESINKLLKEQNVGWFKSWFGAAQTGDIKKYIGGDNGTGGFTGKIQGITARGEASISNAATPEAQKAARAKMDADLEAAYKEAQDWIAAEIKKAEALAHPAEFGIQSRGAAGLFGAQPRDESARLAELNGLKTALAEQSRFVSLQSTNTALTGKKAGLEGEDAKGGKKDQAELARLNDELAKAQEARLKGLEKIDAEETAEIDHLNEIGEANKANLLVVAQIYDAKRLATYSEEMDKYDKLLGESAVKWESLGLKAYKAIGEFDSDAIKAGKQKLEDYSKALAKVTEPLAKLIAEQDKLAIEHQSRMISLAPGAAANPVATLQLQQAPERAAIAAQYGEQIALANQQLALAQQDNNQQGILLATLQKQRLEAERKLAVDRLDDELAEKQAETRQKGVKDFFREMQGQAQTAGNIFYDAMTSGLDRVSDQLAKLLTGQKTNFGKMLQGLGEEMVKESTKSLMHQGLGKLGDLIFGKKKDVEAHKPTGNPGDAVHVLVDNQPGAPGAPVSAGNFQNLAGLVGAGSSGLAGLLKGLFSAGGAGASSGLTEAVSSSITFMAGGGDVDPGGAYVVGEHEPEFFSPRTAGTITPMSKMRGGGDTHNWNIDARGADLGAANRISRALEATHQSAVATAVRANAQRSWRVPQRAKA